MLIIWLTYGSIMCLPLVHIRAALVFPNINVESNPNHASSFLQTNCFPWTWPSQASNGKVVRLGDIPWFEAWSLVWQYVAFGADMFLSTFFSRHHIPPDQLEGEGITIARLTAHHLWFPKPLWNTGSILHINWLAWFRSSTVPLATNSQYFWEKKTN